VERSSSCDTAAAEARSTGDISTSLASSHQLRGVWEIVLCWLLLVNCSPACRSPPDGLSEPVCLCCLCCLLFPGASTVVGPPATPCPPPQCVYSCPEVTPMQKVKSTSAPAVLGGLPLCASTPSWTGVMLMYGASCAAATCPTAACTIKATPAWVGSTTHCQTGQTLSSPHQCCPRAGLSVVSPKIKHWQLSFDAV
jgi:hypothetical protein